MFGIILKVSTISASVHVVSLESACLYLTTDLYKVMNVLVFNFLQPSVHSHQPEHPELFDDLIYRVQFFRLM